MNTERKAAMFWGLIYVVDQTGRVAALTMLDYASLPLGSLDHISVHMSLQAAMITAEEHRRDCQTSPNRL